MPALLLALLAASQPEAEARISLDVKDAPAVDVVRVLSEVADFQAVFDPGVSCTLTLKLTGVRASRATKDEAIDAIWDRFEVAA